MKVAGTYGMHSGKKSKGKKMKYPGSSKGTGGLKFGSPKFQGSLKGASKGGHNTGARRKKGGGGMDY